MRMLGLGLLAFVLAGTAIAISYLDLWQRGWRQVEMLTVGQHLVFESRGSAAPVPAGAPGANVYRAGPEGPIVLTGFPAYQGVEFLLPATARPLAGVLKTEATIQGAAGIEGALRVSVNNSRRGELLLRPGDGSGAIQIPLTAEDLAGERLVVAYSLQGDSPIPACGAEEAGPAVVVEIEADSHVKLTLDRPMEDPRDRMLAGGGAARAGWPVWLPAEERPRRLAIAAELARRGVAVEFVADGGPEAMDTEQMRALADAGPRLLPAPVAAPPSWPVSIAAEGANAGVRHFIRETTWRSRFDAGTLPGGALPGGLDLSLVLGPLPPGEYWTVTAAYNGRLVHAEQAQAGAFERRIPLPAEAGGASNLIEVTTSSSDDPDGPCNRGPALVAEMTPASALVAGGPAFVNGLAELRAALQGRGALHVAVGDTMNGVDATLAARLLASVVPVGVELLAAENDDPSASTALATRDIDLVSAAEGDGRWLLWSEGPGFVAQAAVLDSQLAARMAGRSITSIMLELPPLQDPDERT